MSITSFTFAAERSCKKNQDYTAITVDYEMAKETQNINIYNRKLITAQNCE